jgi:predicted DNA-binding protein (UPF0251 family)
VRLRATAAKRGRRETQVVNMPEPTVPTAHDADVQAVVDEELSRLPDHYRGVVVLCDLEGMTRKEAARQLGIPEGSVASRLARARALLAKRLTQRGIVFSGGSVAAVLSAGSASASAPPALVASTMKAVSLLAAGQAAGVVSAKVAALTEGVVQAMFTTKIKSVLAVVLVVGLALGGVAGLLHQTQAADQPKGAPSAAEKDQKDEKGRPMTKEEPAPKNAKQEQGVLTPEEAIKQMPKENVTVQFKVAKVEAMHNPAAGFGGPTYYIFLSDGGKFTARMAKTADQIMKLGIDPVKHFTGKVVRVTGRVEAHSGSSYRMWVREITDIEVMDRAF